MLLSFVSKCIITTINGTVMSKRNVLMTSVICTYAYRNKYNIILFI